MSAQSLPAKPPIRRNRTGCFTCRRRKKKCDELKPQCYNCQRNGIICDGYPALVSYGLNTSQQRRRSEPRKTHHHGETQSQGYVFSPGDSTTLFDEDLDFLFEGDSFLLPDIRGDEMDHDGLTLDPSYGQILESSDSQNALVLQSGVFNSTTTSNKRRHTPSMTICQSSRNTSSSGQIPRNGSLNDLPFLLDNVNTPAERRLFFHFTTLTSRVLTLSNGKYNPLTSIVVPLASKDPMVMQSLLCLAGSHLVSINSEGDVQDLNLEKHRLHDLATRAQALRIQALERWDCHQSPTELEAVLTSALLLCLYEICEGSGDATWRLHLETARKLISWTMSKNDNKTGDSSSDMTLPLPPEINRFLLEFFIYHDTLAAVTVSSSLPILSPRIYHPENHVGDDAYLVGVNDGLCDLVTRIAELRSLAVGTPKNQTGDILCEAVVIWDDLAKWKPLTTDPEQRLIGSLYQWALFIWLYCIVHPDGVTDEKLQTAVKRAIDDLEQVQAASGVLSCLLFPLFIIGTASIEADDRLVVESHFKSLRAWSGLGNVKVAHDIVQRSWESHDNDVPRSWDWIAQMEMHGISVPVT